MVTDAGMRASIAQVTDYGRFIAQSPACIAVFCKETTDSLALRVYP